MLSVSGEPTDQSWGWREFALADPDGYVWSIYQDKSGGQWTGLSVRVAADRLGRDRPGRGLGLAGRRRRRSRK